MGIKYGRINEIIQIIYLTILINIYYISNISGLEIKIFINELGEYLIGITGKNILYIIIINIIYFIIFKRSDIYDKIQININNKYLSLELNLILILNLISFNLLLLVNDLLLLFISLELFSFILYLFILLKTSHKNSIISILYLLINSLASFFFLLGISLIYKNTGTLYLNNILFSNIPNYSTEYWELNSLSIGYLIIIFSILFKLGLAPLHFAIIRVYPSLDYTLLFYFIIIPKLIYFYLLNQFISSFLLLDWYLSLNNKPFLIGLLLFFSIFSIFIGSISGLFHNHINNLLTYSSILNLGFFFFSYIIYILNFNPSLKGFLGDNPFNLFEFLFIYLINSILIFSSLFLFNKNNQIFFLSPAFKYPSPEEGYPPKEGGSPFFSISILISIFSFIGIPPFAGFFGKLNIFSSLLSFLNPFFLYLVLFLFFSSILSAFFYFKFIYSIYFLHPNPQSNILGKTEDLSFIILNKPFFFTFTLSLSTLVISLYPFFFFYLSPLFSYLF